jgi:hypothetical protein
MRSWWSWRESNFPTDEWRVSKPPPESEEKNPPPRPREVKVTVVAMMKKSEAV